MPDSNSTSSHKSVFEQIEDALGSTARGRAFLAECERRGRAEETALLLDAVARLERRAGDDSVDREELCSLIGQVELAIRDARLALAGSLSESHERHRAGETSSVATFGRETTLAILDATEAIQDIAWRMREAGFDTSMCDRLEARTSAIYAACRRQDRMLDGLNTVERTIGRADAFLGELRRSLLGPDAEHALSPTGTGAATLADGDIEFVRVEPTEPTDPD